MNTSGLKYILYARKSSEAEDRQVASIDAQIEELQRIAKDQGLVITAILQESCSAKEPGRPVFNSVIQKLQKGEVQGLLCWKLDRLARNPVDGGQITWMLQQNIIQHIKTFDRSYYPNDNVLMMSVEFGMANQYVIDLSVNVKRGLNKKVREGVFPCCAPLGYLNSPDRDQGDKVIVEDPLRFKQIRKMWDLMLSGNYTPPQIMKLANEEWGFTTPKHRTQGGKPLARSSVYKLFTSSFYYGWFEWPKGSGEWFKGNHTSMVTREEFDKVQVALGRPLRPAPKARTFAFTGILTCGECGSAITAEEKHQLICSNCKYKFAYGNKTACPGCGLSIKQMNQPTILKYVYYHCTKRKTGVKCSQRSLAAKEFLEQLDRFLASIQINKEFLNWSLKYLQKTKAGEEQTLEKHVLSRQHAIGSIEKKFEKLIDMRLSEQIDEGIFMTRKRTLLKEKHQLVSSGIEQDESIAATEQIFIYAHHARFWLHKAIKKNNLQWQREIFSHLSIIGSNLTLTDKKLNIDKLEPYFFIANGLEAVPQAKQRFEPEICLMNKRQKSAFSAMCPQLLAVVDSIRTYYKSHAPLKILKLHKDSSIKRAA